MGGGVAINLAKNGWHVTGYDLAKPLVDRLVEAGGKAGSTPADTARDAEFLCIMVGQTLDSHMIVQLSNNTILGCQCCSDIFCTFR